MARVALVTGGTRGIGAAIAKRLKAEGCDVAATYGGNDEAAKAFTEETGIRTYKWSVGDYAACKAGIAAVEADLGPVDILVNNAGITRDAPFHKMTPAQWQEVIDTNLTGVFNMTHNVWAGMRERKFGRVVTISSINGQKGPVRAGQLRRVEGRRHRLFEGPSPRRGGAGRITVNVGLPGLHQHRDDEHDPREGDERGDFLPQIPVGRLGEADEIARCVAFLASDGTRAS